jgi:hypothetical protein
MLPTFLGIGAPKCATTWLYQCLREHPEVFMSAIKEVDFFRAGSIAGRLPEYEAHFEQAGDARAIGEISVRYFTSELAPARIAATLPDVRLIAALRNPMDQVNSHYWHLRRQNFHVWPAVDLPRTFEEALVRFDELLVGTALYHRHLERWLSHFDRSRLLVVLHDDVVARPVETLSTVYRFIGVDPDFEAPSATARGLDTRRGGEPRSAAHDAIYRRLHEFLSGRVFLPLKRTIGVRAAERVKETLRARQVLQGAFYRTGYPDMPAGVRKQLAARFAPDVARLSTLLGRDLSHWS